MTSKKAILIPSNGNLPHLVDLFSTAPIYDRFAYMEGPFRSGMPHPELYMESAPGHAGSIVWNYIVRVVSHVGVCMHSRFFFLRFMF